MNIILKPFNCCPECYSDNLTKDLTKLEITCSDCGLVVANNIPLTLTEAIKEHQKEQQQLKELKQHEKLKPIIEAYEKHLQHLQHRRKYY